MEIINLTPHAVTIVRPNQPNTVFPACDLSSIPRATESNGRAPVSWLSIPPGDDTQSAYETDMALSATGLIDHCGYNGIENLPDLEMKPWPGPPARCYIVSIITAIGAVAAQRSIIDLLIPMGQIRDGAGRIIGATSLAPASDLLWPFVAEVERRQRDR